MFHPINKDAQLNHLIFVDYLMLFRKGAVSSLHGLIALAHFSDVTGLLTNIDKSSIFMVGVIDEVKSQVIAETRLSIGTFPIRYLGLPLSSKKWRKMECQQLAVQQNQTDILKTAILCRQLQVINVVSFLNP